MADDIAVQKVRKQGEQKILCIPKKSNFQIGDYVIIRKLNAEIAQITSTQKNES